MDTVLTVYAAIIFSPKLIFTGMKVLLEWNMSDYYGIRKLILRDFLRRIPEMQRVIKLLCLHSF
jgi:hypothetical protein